jgi:hypothetical protein
MSNLASYFTGIIDGLRRMAHIRPLPVAADRLMLIVAYAWLFRTAIRFQRLHARWLAGKLRPPVPRLAAPPARPAPPPAPDPAAPPQAPARPRLTRRRGWLRHALGQDAGNFGSQIVHMLLRPDIPAFLAAAPQAGRLLRPLLHLIGTDIPAELALPPRPPRRRTPKPRLPRPPIRWGKYTARDMRNYSPGRIPKPGTKTKIT